MPSHVTVSGYSGAQLPYMIGISPTNALNRSQLLRSGAVHLTARLFDGLPTRTLIAEGLHRNKAHRGGQGINMLTSAQPAPPFGGVPFHDAAVWIRKAD